MSNKSATNAKRQQKRNERSAAINTTIMEATKNINIIRQSVDEIVEDNIAVVNAVKRLHTDQNALRSAILVEIDKLRIAIAQEISVHALRGICMEFAPMSSVLDHLLQKADFSNAELIREHIESFARSFERALQRQGIERMPIVVGSDLFDIRLHECVKSCEPADSPFPEAPPKTIVFIQEYGYLLRGQVAQPAKVWVQALDVKDTAINEGESS